MVDSRAEMEALTAGLAAAAERLKSRREPEATPGDVLGPALARLEAAGGAVRDARRRLAELAATLPHG